MTKHLTLETERLFLRPTSFEDADFVLRLMNTPKWMENIGDRKVRTEEDARNYIKNKMHPQLDRLGFSNYTVIRKDDGQKMGSCGLYDREGLEGVDIGFAFLPEFEGKGYAFEAAQKVLDTGISHFGITKVSAITIEANLPSRKLIEKLGLTFSKIINLPDDPEDLMLYELKI
ncbi:MAG: N-acetyltransferase [Bacteroidetes bacterium]|nr:MAG: N-acetyltransferase [Bacteroidota bacterium]